MAVTYLKSVNRLILPLPPQNRFVAGFIGSPKMNFMSVHIEQAEAERVLVQLSNGMTFWIPVDGNDCQCWWPYVSGCSSWALVVCWHGDATIEAEVMMVEKLGNETQVYLNLESADADKVFHRQPDTLTIESVTSWRLVFLHTVVTCSTAWWSRMSSLRTKECWHRLIDSPFKI